MTDDESNDDETTYTHYVSAGEIDVEVEAESSVEATKRFEELWDKVLADLDDLDGDERDQIGLR